MWTPTDWIVMPLRVACGVFAMAVFGALAQSTTPNAPVMKPGATAPAKVSPAPSSAPTAPRKRIELTPAERQSIDAQSSPAPTTQSAAEELVPTAADLAAPPPEESAVRIEQFRTANRVTEVKVFPSFGGPTYVMTNREGRQPLFQTDLGPGLSVPKFFRWEFGSPNPAPPAAPPPPTR